ncbi:hypothetical protein [Streptomyces sp. NPDC001315]|uniref:hypothetical protein n=1 Tax=Streptomyces sp. NPDC001315 TaxID=3364562 RepID=UPI0036A810E0
MRVRRIDDRAATLRDSAGNGTVAGNVTGALTDLFDSVALTLIGSAHMLFAGRDGAPPEAGAAEHVVATVTSRCT